jgi:hypothetical protein
MKPIVFTSITLAHLASLRTLFVANGGTQIAQPNANTPDEQILKSHGVEVKATYNPEAQTLTVVVLSKPFFVPMELIESELDKALHAPDVKEVSVNTTKEFDSSGRPIIRVPGLASNPVDSFGRPIAIDTTNAYRTGPSEVVPVSDALQAQGGTEFFSGTHIPKV